MVEGITRVNAAASVVWKSKMLSFPGWVCSLNLEFQGEEPLWGLGEWVW
jgi:hypothetical protein